MCPSVRGHSPAGPVQNDWWVGVHACMHAKKRACSMTRRSTTCVAKLLSQREGRQDGMAVEEIAPNACSTWRTRALAEPQTANVRVQLVEKRIRQVRKSSSACVRAHTLELYISRRTRPCPFIDPSHTRGVHRPLCRKVIARDRPRAPAYVRRNGG